ncbi:unnamed protein product [Prorocentrum cordatum]|uniref:Serine/threonine specific protein phosphatases domain-containing protein n=1 Tax=Prorocentrum cordatum TaxID=2364126 RepID=A0ABN9Q3U9_9DINO|nr:unnamed protein product [Polarella glacialis]
MCCGCSSSTDLHLNQYLFDGDIVDRGGHALEILLLLLALKRDDESCVHILRGNHEDDAQTCSTYGFRNEIQSKFGQAGGDAAIMKTCIYQVFPHLPLAAVVSDAHGQFSLCVVHGGIPVGCPGQLRRRASARRALAAEPSPAHSPAQPLEKTRAG